MPGRFTSMSGMRTTPPRLPCAPSMRTPSPAARTTRSSTKRAPPCVCTSHPRPAATTITSTPSSARTRRNQRRRARVCGGGGDSRWGVSTLLMSERDRDREREPDLVRVLRVREVDGEGTRGRLEARAEAVARVGLHVLGAVLGVAHVHERGGAPAFVQPMHVLDGPGGEVAPADDRLAVLNAEALVRVAAVRAR